MSSKGNATASSSSPVAAAAVSPSSGKRSRDPEDEVYVDNLHSHKRYLSEIMASSLNGLTVGDPLSESPIDSSVRDEISTDYSAMSEDSDDSRCNYEIMSSTNTFSSQPESVQTSPVSPPYRCQKPQSGFGSSSFLTASSYPNPSQQSRQQRGSDAEGRFPSSPSDICHSADLRKAALLRSVQMRAQPLEMPCNSGQQSGGNIMEADPEHTYSCLKSLVDERELYQIVECSPLSISETEKQISFNTGIINLKGDE